MKKLRGGTEKCRLSLICPMARWTVWISLSELRVPPVCRLARAFTARNYASGTCNHRRVTLSVCS